MFWPYERCADVGIRQDISPVAGDYVVGLVGLEPATRLLWAGVRVRPAPHIRALHFGYDIGSMPPACGGSLVG
jgi:hypothetical protein